MRQTDSHHGWRNLSTWNAALWIRNDEPLYRSAVAYVVTRDGRPITWDGFLDYAGLTGLRTPDGILWDSRLMDRAALVDMLRELADGGQA